MITDEQLTLAKLALEAGRLPFQVVRDEGWDVQPGQVRQALLTTFGRDIIQPLLQAARANLPPGELPPGAAERMAARAGRGGDGSEPRMRLRGGDGEPPRAGLDPSRLLGRLVASVTSQPGVTAEHLDAVLAELENAIVQINVKKAELKG